ncbi:MAG: carbamoyltransferase HypF [Phycisphaeraceae bacterium]|nr:carbamoyltransferase HypF [Phycisphaeraceae bacterium]
MTRLITSSQAIERRRARVRGQVQGVGFRPFVFRLATRLGLHGHVGNDGDGVFLEVQGRHDAMAEFVAALRDEAPPMARMDDVQWTELPELPEIEDFHIVPTPATQQAPTAEVTVDAAICQDCLREMRDLNDPRYGYGLINCMHCGPRFSIIRTIPYDRPNTTMAGFAMCGRCASQYALPSDRRFHAQPIACPHCGPRVALVGKDGKPLPGEPIIEAAKLLMMGRVLAIKGLGGFHLAARARDVEAVRRLRRLKHRDHKPLAVMCPDLGNVRKLVRLSQCAQTEMLSPVCPIVLVPRLADADVAHEVAPGQHRLGVMLPYTPLQHLLFDMGQRLMLGGLGPLVMTSANQSDEPLVISNEEALTRLGQADLCDAILWHDRPIERGVDDSVILDMQGGEPLPIRRARGYVPSRLTLPVTSSAPGLCVGGELKNTVAVVREDHAILSQHLGDLKHPQALANFKRTISDMRNLFQVDPAWIACDLHPAYLSTQYAKELAEKQGLKLIPVQHHHAHAAAVMAEHHTSGPVLAVVCDGVGYGDDGQAWGGEVLLATLTGYRRLGHLEPLLLPGGDAAARDTRRCALALLHQALGEAFDQHELTRSLFPDDAERQVMANLIRRNLHCVTSSAAGRVFDGFAALLGLATYNHYEAQAGMRLESEAHAASDRSSQPLFDLTTGEVMTISFAPLVRRLLRPHRGTAGDLAFMLHDQMAQAFDAALALAADRTGIHTVALTGGVFCNQLLTRLLTQRLLDRGMTVLRHRQVPPNDGGLALGQAAVAAAIMQTTSRSSSSDAASSQSRVAREPFACA